MFILRSAGACSTASSEILISGTTKLLTSKFGGIQEDYCFSFKWKNHKDAAEQALNFFKRKNKPTAMLCTSDLVALPLIVQAPFAGVKIPEDMSIIGFEDLEACKYVFPAMTTIRHDYFQSGCAAAEELLGIIEDCNLRKINRKLEPELIIRDSCAAPSIARNSI